MSNTITIKREKGKFIKINAESLDDQIVLTKSTDKSNSEEKRRIIIETIDNELYRKFKEIEREIPLSSKIIDFLKERF